MNKHIKKMIVPIIITLIFVLYFVFYLTELVLLLEGFWKYALGIIPLLLIIVMIMVCVERIKEIKKGEEDDLSKY